jgi:hypothetical protein
MKNNPVNEKMKSLESPSITMWLAFLNSWQHKPTSPASKLFPFLDGLSTQTMLLFHICKHSFNRFFSPSIDLFCFLEYVFSVQLLRNILAKYDVLRPWYEVHRERNGHSLQIIGFDLYLSSPFRFVIEYVNT